MNSGSHRDSFSPSLHRLRRVASCESRKSGEQRSEVATELIKVVFNPTMSTPGGGGGWTEASNSGGRNFGPSCPSGGLAVEKSYCGAPSVFLVIAFIVMGMVDVGLSVAFDGFVAVWVEREKPEAAGLEVSSVLLMRVLLERNRGSPIFGFVEVERRKLVGFETEGLRVGCTCEVDLKVPVRLDEPVKLVEVSREDL